MSKEWTPVKFEWDVDVGIVQVLNEKLQAMRAVNNLSSLIEMYDACRANVKYLMQSGRIKWEQAYAKNILRLSRDESPEADDEQDDNESSSESPPLLLGDSAITYRFVDRKTESKGVYLVTELPDVYGILTDGCLLSPGEAAAVMSKIRHAARSNHRSNYAAIDDWDVYVDGITPP